MDCGVSAAICEQARGPIMDEINQHRPVSCSDVIVTDPHGLNAIYLLHAISSPDEGDATEQSIRDVTQTVLARADALDCRTLVLPVLGWGGGSYELEAGARFICERIWAFEPTSLADVRIIGHTEQQLEQLRAVAYEVRTTSQAEIFGVSVPFFSTGL
ncbi:macro domain-containing protein [Halorussus limi]|uniref:Macro domain-containing protein n=3 Tax=Haladaptataceae TaxID=3064797 RepID=A0A8U0II07_9EURY|nr:macro domain-containing protein [Halorussus limi]UPV99913.1 macro domain-containing protein [Halorussus gelatinilyticus]